jgi:phosphodiesterase/alkaline phosphatase D-like protein
MSIEGRSKTSIVAGVTAALTRSWGWGVGASPGSARALQTANGRVGEGIAPAPIAGASRRAFLALALLAIAIVVAVYAGMAGRHSSAVPAAGLRASSRIHPGASSQKKGLLSLPLAAQGPVSEALGAGSPAYRIGASAGGFAGSSPTQHFRVRFDRSGLSLSSARNRVGLSLRAVGYGASLNALSQVAPRVHTNRVSYVHPGLTETYVNGPLGLEQTFAIAKAPAGRQTGALTLAMAISGNVQPSLRAGGQSLTFGNDGKTVLRYSGLSVTDARGRALRSWLQLTPGAVLLRVDARGARYPLRVDPFIQQGEKLTGAGEKSEQGALSYSVAMSIEGTTTTALVGARNDRAGVGAAWVFTRTGTTWTQQGSKLTAKGNEEVGTGEFGQSVALSVEGTTTTALIGAPGDNEHIGAAWVFTRTGTTWTQQGGKLTAKSGEETVEGSFGFSVALLAKEGTTALIGAPGDTEHAGAAWAFARSGTTWTQQGTKLVAKSPEETGAGEFGDSLAMSIEGTTVTALVGAPGDKGAIGAAWVFTRTGTTWAQQGTKLVAKAGEETGAGEFGSGVALSLEGTTMTALIGAPGEGTGAAWVLTRSGTTWTQQGTKLVAKSGEESASGEFGFSVALSLEGTTMTALIGGPGDAEHIGAAWVFTRTGTTWTQQGGKLTAKSGEEIGEGSFGYSVALLAKEGTTALIGAPGDNKNIGATWAFTRSGTTWTQQGEKLTAKSGEESGESEAAGKGAFGYSVAMSIEGTTATALVGARNDRSGIGAAWVFTRTGTTWAQQGAKLAAKSPEELGAGEFGASVALSLEGTTMTALVGAPADNSGVGAAWVFTRTGTTWTQQGGKLIAKSGEETGEGSFGYSVALLAKEGTTALIGAPGDTEHVGAAWAFARSGTTWTQQGAKLVAKSGEETGKGEFGDSVAISIESTTATALIGARGDKEGIGAAWVFTRSGTAWTQQGTKLVAKSPEETGQGSFGSGVALALEGTTMTALIGASGDKEHLGAAWVFTRSGTTWTQQGTKLAAKSGEETAEGFFGFSVALSLEGTTMTALIGAPHDNADIGTAFAFTRSGTTWTQQGAKLTAKTPEEFGKGEFGYSVALLAKEGTTALFGTPSDNKNVGAAWAFTRSGTTWTQQGEKLAAKASEEIGEEGSAGKGAFGYSVALSSEGNTALIGGPPDLAVGAAWVFTRSGTTWTQQGAKLTPKNGEEIGAGEFGSSVALSANGSTALIGGFRDNGDVGAAWVFTRSGTTWTQQGGKLTAKSGEELGQGEFGVSVALSSEGNTALIGGSGEAVGFDSHRGAAWVFTRSGTTWTQQGAKLTGGEAVGSGEFGFSVALSASGSAALIGGPGDNGVGAAWAFTRSGSTWTQQGKKLTPKSGEETGEGAFGSSVALSGEASTALIGAPLNKEAIGAVWVFTSSGGVWTQQGEKLTGSGEVGAGEFGDSLALSANGGTALIGGPQDNGKLGAAWVFTRSGTIWTQQGTKLTPKTPEEIGEGLFGSSVALSSEANTAFIGGPADNNTIGAAWAFTNTSPAAETKPPSAITQTSGTLNGTVNPDGLEVTKCEFEYGTTIPYAKTAPCTPSPGSGSSPVAVSATVTGLTANTTYHYRVVATNSAGTSQGPDETFKTLANPPTVVTKPATAVAQTSATLNATVNPNGPEVSKCEFEYGTSIAYGKTAKCAVVPGPGESAVAVSASVSSLTPNTPYHFRIVAANSSGESKGSDETLKTLAGTPTVETKPSTSITNTGVTLNGTVNPNGGEVTTCILEIATAEFYEANGKAYESGEECASLPGSGTSPVPVSVSTGVSANTTYHVRILACNSAGCSEGTDLTFKTLPNPPTVVTKAASALTMTSATLNATVNPNSGEVSKCEFEYGTTISYGKTAACTPAPGSGSSAVAVSASVTGLTAGTAYHFRIVSTNAGGKGEGADETLKTIPNPPVVVTKAASGVGSGSASLTGTVNPNNGEVSKCEFEYGTTIGYGKVAACSVLPGSGSSPVAVSASVTGLAANTVYHFRLVAVNAGGKGEGADESLKTLPNVPAVVTGAASAVGQSTATLGGSVNPNSGEVSKCEFEYGPTVSYGKVVACSSLPGSGSSPVAVSASVTGLTAGSSYHFRLVAVNAGGRGEGGDESFTTAAAVSAPTAVTGAGSSVSASVASVNGSVNPNKGQVTDCRFEYGTTVAYGGSVACRPTPGGAGTSPVGVSAPLSGLAAGTTYHFRVTATNSAGKGEGSDQTFTTTAASHVHWYQSATRLEEGRRVPFLSWGPVALTSSKGGASTECQAAVGGYVENLKGAVEGAFAGEGVDEVNAFALYNCTNAECEAEGGRAGVLADELPWPGGLTEAVKGTVRLASTGVQLYVHCQLSSSPASEKAGTGPYAGLEERTSVEFTEPGAMTCTTNPGGSMTPRLVNGASVEKPSKFTFSAGAGGELECGATGKLATTGNLKITGYAESELLTVKNP